MEWWLIWLICLMLFFVVGIDVNVDGQLDFCFDVLVLIVGIIVNVFVVFDGVEVFFLVQFDGVMIV